MKGTRSTARAIDAERIEMVEYVRENGVFQRKWSRGAS